MRITEKGKEWIPKRKRFVWKRSMAITEAAELESVREPPFTKSPVPSPSALDNGESVAVNVEKPKLEVMKVAELKEVAKSRGVKGYYKLKKQELLELLLVDSITEA
ncbi:SAP-like protein BP-73 [Linum perenne]